MIKNSIKYISITLLLISTSCASANKISIDHQISSEIKNKEFTIVLRENNLLNFSSSSFLTNFVGVIIPYGLVWIPKMNGTKQAKKYDLQDPVIIFKKDISKTLTAKYNMRPKDNSIITTEDDVKKLSELYKNYAYIVDVSDVGSLTYVKLDDHRLDFFATFKMIDTKQSKVIAQTTCSYSSTKDNYKSKSFYLDNEAKNLKRELSEAVSQCLGVFKADI